MPANRVAIHYCSQCNWLLRSAWYAQELLATFSDELDEVALQPGTGGVFRIDANGEQIWDRKTDGGFPEITELKRRVRDVVCPARELGHIDRKDT
ncbi:MAG: SelT/SelW/SelH family protein [Pseudomonadota bacterium]|nr:SelT/SelW/SelH family protein [Pseudomonadota bacterium]